MSNNLTPDKEGHPQAGEPNFIDTNEEAKPHPVEASPQQPNTAVPQQPPTPEQSKKEVPEKTTYTPATKTEPAKKTTNGK